MGKGDRRTAHPPRHATHNSMPGMERETNIRVARVDISAMTTRSAQKLRKWQLQRATDHDFELGLPKDLIRYNFTHVLARMLPMSLFQHKPKP